MSSLITHEHGQQYVSFSCSNSNADYKIGHTCPDPSTLTDEKIEGMGLVELIRFQGQLQADISKFREICRPDFDELGRDHNIYKDFGKAAKSSESRDTVTLQIITTAIEMKKRAPSAEIAQLKDDLSKLTLRVAQLELAVINK